MIWFTSDQHFGHTNIIKYCNRPFDNERRMTYEMIQIHNSMVRPEDTVYHLGDFTFNKDHNQYLNFLAGQHHFIRGNHDHKNFDGRYVSVNDTKMVRYEGNKIWLSHYSHRVWPESHRGAIHLFGHSHGTLPGFGRSMDVGVDTNNFELYSANEIVNLMAKVDFKAVDHHLEAFKDCK